MAQPSPLSAFNLDEAIAESLRAEAEFRRYNASATALTDCLESNGFVELSVDLTRDELLQGYEALTYVEPALASSGTSHFDSSIGSFVIRPIAPVMTVPPTALQFYFDLFGLGDPEKHAYNEVLVSYLHLHDDREQTYKLYACDSLADIEFLLSSIRNEPALIFTGRFQTRNGAYRMPLNTQRAQQRTLNAICVDIDPSHNGVEDEDGPIDPVVLERIFERIDGRLLPSYVCLTGRGTFSMSPCKRSEFITPDVRNTRLWPMRSMRIMALSASISLACSIHIAPRLITGFALRGRLRSAVRLFAAFVPLTAFSSIQR